jgi:hypothetical protein
MTTSSEGQELLRAVETMSEEESAAWIAAGDYSSIGGIPISDDDARRIAELLNAPEVSAYDLGLGSNESPPLGTTPGTLDRKAGKGQHEFLVFTFKTVMVSSY